MTPTVITSFALVLGSALLAVSTFLALRPTAKGSSFGWATVNGLACAILGLAAAIRFDGSGGFRAALVQLVTVALAVLLATLSLPARQPRPAVAEGVGAAGRGLAWMALVGLPPTIGFHAKVILCRAILVAGWGWVAALVLATSAILLTAGLREIRSPCAGTLHGPRAVSVMALIALTIVLGFYPYLWLFVNAITGNLAGSA